MTRRTRRRVYAVVMAALVGTSSPLWAPPLLSRMDTFRVEEVGVVGARYVPPDEVVRRADVAAEASVWDDPSRWEARVRSHPLVRDAEVRRAGLSQLEIRVHEVEPVALVAVPELVPVDAEGHALPLDPAESELDLPVLGGRARLEDGRLAGDTTPRLLRLLVALRGAEPGFVSRVSEVGTLETGGVEIFLAGTRNARRVLLPSDHPVDALRRVEMALSRHEGERPVDAADARFDGQVVLRLEGPTGAPATASARGRTGRTGAGRPRGAGSSRGAGT